MSAPAGFTQIIAANIQDGWGNKLATGSLYVQPTDANDCPIDATAGGAGGAISTVPASTPITAGAVAATAWVPDTTQTKPLNIYFRFTVRDAQGNLLNVLRGVQPSGPTFNLDTYAPSGSPLALRTPGFNFRGPWTANTYYALYDLVTYNGSSYTPSVSFTSGSTFDGTHLALVAAKGEVTGLEMGAAFALLPAINVFDPAQVTYQQQLDIDGTITGIAGDNHFYVSALFLVRAGGTISCNVGIPSGGSPYPAFGACFYDAAMNFISGTPGVAAYTNIAVPSTAVFGRICADIRALAVNQVVVMRDVAIPAGLYVYPGTTIAASQAIASSSGAIALINSPIINLFDPNRVTYQQLLSSGGIYGIAGDNHFYTSDYFPVRPGGNLYCNSGIDAGGGGSYPAFGWIFYDANYNQVGFVQGAGANVAVPVPANAVWGRFGADITALAVGSVVVLRDIPVPAGVYVYPGMTIAASLAIQAVTKGPAAGAKWAHFGDSISAIYGGSWLPTVLQNTGLVQVFQDAHTGRQTSQIFENYGGNASTGVGLGGNFGGSVQTNIWSDGLQHWAAAGNTLPQDLAAAAPDLITIYLGTNDTNSGSYTLPIGTPGDATTAGTECGYVRAAIEGILSARPGARLLWIAPYKSFYQVQNGTQEPVVNAILGTCALYGVPVLNLDATSGISPFNWSSYLQSDDIHPAALGFTMLERRVTDFINRQF